MTGSDDRLGYHRRRVRVLIADDHLVTRVGIRTLLVAEAGVSVVAEAITGPEAVAQYRAHQPDVGLIDLRMPGMSGVETIKAIRAEFPHARLVVLTSSETSEDIYRAMEAGARGYLLKDASGPALVQALRDVRAGLRALTPEMAQRLADRPPESALSPREVEVLRLAAAGYSNKRIGAALEISEATVRTHMSNILGKLGADDRTQAATEAIRRGIL